MLILVLRSSFNVRVGGEFVLLPLGTVQTNLHRLSYVFLVVRYHSNSTINRIDKYKGKEMTSILKNSFL